jgi:ABC-type cobalamin/Fe3+-siderophores transport system ATPase subunit
MNPIIQIQNLSLALNGVSILNNVSLDVATGEYVSIIGPNGAGKTSLLRCLLGMYPHSGTAQINGRESTAYESRELAQTISYVPQTHDIEFPLSVYDFVMMGRYPYLKPLSGESRRDLEAVENALEMTETGSFRKRTLRTLSGGERQKVYIAAALAQETPIILLDEPGTFLDYRHQTDVMKLLKRINTERDVTILAVNHDLNSAAQWSDRLIGLKDGKVFCSGTPNEILQPDPLAALFDTPFLRKETLVPATS